MSQKSLLTVDGAQSLPSLVPSLRIQGRGEGGPLLPPGGRTYKAGGQGLSWKPRSVGQKSEPPGSHAFSSWKQRSCLLMELLKNAQWFFDMVLIIDCTDSVIDKWLCFHLSKHILELRAFLSSLFFSFFFSPFHQTFMELLLCALDREYIEIRPPLSSSWNCNVAKLRDGWVRKEWTLVD